MRHNQTLPELSFAAGESKVMTRTDEKGLLPTQMQAKPESPSQSRSISKGPRHRSRIEWFFNVQRTDALIDAPDVVSKQSLHPSA